MNDTPVQALPPKVARFELAGMLFLHAAAMGMWVVCFGNVLKAHALERFIPYAYASTAIAAFISPLAVGALADQRISPTKIFRWLGVLSAFFLAAAFYAIDCGANPFLMLGLLQVHSLCAVPATSLLTTIVMSRLTNPQQEFGPIRAGATVGWMAAGWAVSWVMMADTSTRSGYGAAILWLAVAAFSLLLPELPPPEYKGARTWRDKLGLEALSLFKVRDHRVVYITAALFNAPLAAFYPFTPMHLRASGLEQATGLMTIGQISETFAMFGLATLLTRVRLKWVFLAGIGFGVVRYALFALDQRTWLITGIALHGFAFALYFITAQIYIEQRVEPRMRARAQALFSLMISGFGNLAGYLGSGWWREFCTHADHTHWSRFWLGLTVVTAAVFVFFAVSYAGKSGSPTKS